MSQVIRAGRVCQAIIDRGDMATVINLPEEALSRARIWKDWLNLSTFHGITDIKDPPYGKGWKTAWILVMIIFTALTVYSIEEVITEYISNPTIQNYRTAMKPSLELPDVVLCTHQRLDADALEAMGASPELTRALVAFFENEGDPSRLLRVPAIGIPGHIPEVYEKFRLRNKNVSFDDLLRRTGVRCENIVKQCSWWRFVLPCCALARPFLDQRYGQCYRIGIGRNLTQYGFTYTQEYPGSGSGLQLVLRGSPMGNGTRSTALRGVLAEFLHPDEPLSFAYSQIPAGISATVHLSLQVSVCMPQRLHPLPSTLAARRYPLGLT